MMDLNLSLVVVVFFRVLTWCILKCGINSFALFFPFPQWRKVDFTLRATVWLLNGWRHTFVLGQIIDNRFQAQQIHKFGVAWIWNEVHFWWWWLWWWNL